MTRPAPLRQRRPATCFVCARVCVAGARGGGVAAAWAPQLRRWCWPGAGRSGAPSPTPRVPPLAARRPAPWPPLPPARPRPGFRAVTRAAAAAAAAAAEAAKADALTPGLPGRNRGTESGPGNRGCSVSDSEQRTPRWRQEDAGLVPAAACGACRPAGGEMPPPPWSGGAGPAVQPPRRRELPCSHLPRLTHPHPQQNEPLQHPPPTPCPPPESKSDAEGSRRQLRVPGHRS